MSVLAWLGATTTTLKLGSAIMQIPGRTPANTAMTAATLDLLSGGRFLLGLGTSGPQVVEGWHGQPWAKPLGRTREYVEIVRTALRRETLEFHGEHYDIPRRDGTGLGKPLKLMARPLRADIPIYLAAMSPKAVRQAFEIADGWLPIFWSPEQARHAYSDAFAVARPGFDVAASVPVSSATTWRRLAMRSSPTTRSTSAGWAPAARTSTTSCAAATATRQRQQEIQELYLDGRKRDAAAAVPDAFVDEVALVGPKERIADRIAGVGRVRRDHTARLDPAARGCAHAGRSRAVKDLLEAALGTRLDGAVQVAGGASKEAWKVDTVDGRRLLVRRAGGGVIHENTLSLRDEFETLVAARDAGVRVPEPVAYLGEIDGREAFAMEYVDGETIGRRIVRDPPAGLAVELAEELARIHAIAPERLPFLPAGDLWDALYADLDGVEEPHPRDRVRARLVPGAPPSRASPGWSRTATSASGTSSSGRTVSSRYWTGSSRTCPTRRRTSPGHSSVPGASGPTPGGWAGSTTSSPTSTATPS